MLYASAFDIVNQCVDARVGHVGGMDTRYKFQTVVVNDENRNPMLSDPRFYCGEEHDNVTEGRPLFERAERCPNREKPVTTATQGANQTVADARTS